ncbi:MAG: DNA polymerase III subunit epsilon, partial [Spirochaetota bacterium]|nr:DNA polymerase III subunit epsilon [Spirochaetota bacterium]
MTFTAIDFETANNKRTSACQIGIVVVKDGNITEE